MVLEDAIFFKQAFDMHCCIFLLVGTGKTTTLAEYTKMRPMEKFLNVAYNKWVKYVGTYM